MASQEQHALSLLENLRRLYETDDCFLSDVTLVARDGEIKAHKLILAAQSEFFKGLFRNEKKEKVAIDIASNILNIIVKSLYTGETSVTLDNVQDLLEATNFLQIKELNLKCSDFMARNLDSSNCVAVLRLADTLSNDSLAQEAIDYIADHFQQLFTSNDELKTLSVELFSRIIKSDRIIMYSKFGTILPAIQREEALVRVIVEFVRGHEPERRIKDTWPLFRALKLPFIAHHLDFKQIGLPELASFEADPTLHSLVRSSRIPKEDDLRRRYSVDPFSKHNANLRLYSVKYVIWTERFGSGPNSAYREIRPFSCEGGTDKFMQSIHLLFRPWDDKLILGGLKIEWSNGSTDVAGASDCSPEFQQFSANLEDGENFQRLGLRSGWFVDQIKLTTNKGRVFGPFGGGMGDEKKPHKLLRKCVDPKFVYLDGVRGYVVNVQGKPALNRLSFKWSFVMDKKVSRYSYYNSVIIRGENERLCVGELETEINLTLSDDRQDFKPFRFFSPLVDFPTETRSPFEFWSDEEENNGVAQAQDHPVPHAHLEVAEFLVAGDMEEDDSPGIQPAAGPDLLGPMECIW